MTHCADLRGPLERLFLFHVDHSDLDRLRPSAHDGTSLNAVGDNDDFASDPDHNDFGFDHDSLDDGLDNSSDTRHGDDLENVGHAGPDLPDATSDGYDLPGDIQLVLARWFPQWHSAREDPRQCYPRGVRRVFDPDWTRLNREIHVAFRVNSMDRYQDFATGLVGSRRYDRAVLHWERSLARALLVVRRVHPSAKGLQMWPAQPANCP